MEMARQPFAMRAGTFSSLNRDPGLVCLTIGADIFDIHSHLQLSADAKDSVPPLHVDAEVTLESVWRVAIEGMVPW
jgi:hypothetical protein